MICGATSFKQSCGYLVMWVLISSSAVPILNRKNKATKPFHVHHNALMSNYFTFDDCFFLLNLWSDFCSIQFALILSCLLVRVNINVQWVKHACAHQNPFGNNISQPHHLSNWDHFNAQHERFHLIRPVHQSTFTGSIQIDLDLSRA